MAVIEITTPRVTNDNALAQYFGAVPVDGVLHGTVPWPEADHNHGLNYFNAPSLDNWTDEDANKYIDANHPIIIDERELDLLSDHSHSTNTDSDSRGSSNSYSIGSLPSNGHTNYSHDSDWQQFTAGYSHHGQSQLPLTMTSVSSLYALMDHVHASNPFLVHPSSDILSPTINPATFHHSTPSPVRPTGKVRAHPHPGSSNVSNSLEELPCVSLSELNAPYIPNTQENLDTELKLLSSSEENVPNLPSRKRSRSISFEGREGSMSGSSHLPEKIPLDPAGNIRGSRRRAPSFTSSSSSELCDSPPALKRTRRSSQKVKEELDRVDDDGDDAESDVTDSDIYSPSRSPSVDLSQSDYSESISLPLSRAPKKLRKQILKMSAADALAQLSGSTSSVMSLEPDVEWDPADTRASTSSSSSRRNHSIPVPVPVPHLTKKSRGRKVPYINTRVARGIPFEDLTYDGDDDAIARRSGSSRQGRGTGGGRSGGRSFVCTVEGCGKCFIRGEHLKRHIRSIHTNDKRESFG
ncbi:hypothetical protein C0993_009638 [Termitomyces sp. T159_Od127]|nr:hypothetical protein C0993_009638 [Termitomyces sp. T159_Od127]